MNRLTQRNENGEAYVLLYSDHTNLAILKEYISNKQKEVIERLAAYEDTGLTPEEIENLKSRWTCKDCMHFVGAGDWNLCCGLKPDLCYGDTPACDLFEPLPEPWEGAK